MSELSRPVGRGDAVRVIGRSLDQLGPVAAAFVRNFGDGRDLASTLPPVRRTPPGRTAATVSRIVAPEAAHAEQGGTAYRRALQPISPQNFLSWRWGVSCHGAVLRRGLRSSKFCCRRQNVSVSSA